LRVWLGNCKFIDESFGVGVAAPRGNRGIQIAIDGIDELPALGIAAALESLSEHPLGQSIVEAASHRQLQIDRYYARVLPQDKAVLIHRRNIDEHFDSCCFN
jgi:cation transport ATPase